MTVCMLTAPLSFKIFEWEKGVWEKGTFYSMSLFRFPNASPCARKDYNLPGRQLDSVSLGLGAPALSLLDVRGERLHAKLHGVTVFVSVAGVAYLWLMLTGFDPEAYAGLTQ